VRSIRLAIAAMGELDVTENQIIHFDKGIPGFEANRQLAMIEREEDAPFAHLVSLDDPGISFVVTDPFYFDKEYECVLTEEVQLELAIHRPQDVMILVMVIVSSNPLHSTVNLMAPLVINRETRKGLQFIMHNSPYNIRTPLFASEAGAEQGG
jgi:flagellar assembly factor FliW